MAHLWNICFTKTPKYFHMKKWMLACSLFLFAGALQIQAQDKPKVELSKEKKAALKKMKEEHLAASFTEAGIPDDQAKMARAAMESATEKSNALKADKSLTDDERDARKKAINEEKNGQLKEILGDKYKPWNEIRKKQKAVEEAFASKPE